VGLISIEQLEARLGRALAGNEEDQAEAFIDDASALVLQIAAGQGDEPEWTSPNDPPATIIPVVTSMVRRALENPRGLSGEQLGDYQWQAGQGGQVSIYATSNERRIIRRAAGVLGVGTAQLEGDLAIDTTVSDFEEQWLDSF
jgi:hypothetical protein